MTFFYKKSCKKFSKKYFKISKLDIYFCPFFKISKKFQKKVVENRVVTIMVLNKKINLFFCDDNIFLFLRQYLGVFFLSQCKMDIFIEKNIPKFNCEKCAFTCSKKGDWDRHLLTRKHAIVTLCDNNEHNKNVNTNKDYICKNCSKTYKSRNGLWAHKKTCLLESNKKLDLIVKEEYDEDIKQQNVVDCNLLAEVLKQNQDFQKLWSLVV